MPLQQHTNYDFSREALTTNPDMKIYRTDGTIESFPNRATVSLKEAVEIVQGYIVPFRGYLLNEDGVALGLPRNPHPQFARYRFVGNIIELGNTTLS